MPNEGPYGGKIVIQEDGTVEWQAAGRSFPKTQDIEGTLQYAIRVTTEDRAIVASSDGKCIVHTHPTAGQVFNATTGAVSAMLIVSGYEEPDEEEGAVVVGKSYFVTGGYRDNQESRSHVLPCYDVHLKYDDYDLERANAQIAHLAQRVDEKDLTFCYQRWLSVRFMQEHLGSPDKVADHLHKINAPARRLRMLPPTALGEQDPDIWLSFWNEVQCPSQPRCNQETCAQGAAQKPPPAPRPQTQRHEGEIEGLTVDGIIVTGVRTKDIPGSRTIIVRGIERPGTFALMYHWKGHRHDRH